MTEQEWKTSSDLNAMLLSLPRKGLDRKFRLFACACAWRAWHLMDDDRPRLAVKVAERYADGLADESELRTACSRAHQFGRMQDELAHWDSASAAHPGHNAAHVSQPKSPFDAFAAASSASHAAAIALASAAKMGLRDADADEQYIVTEKAERAIQGELLRDIFRSPFGAMPILDASCRTAPTGALAREIYETKSFDRLPALADLLEEAGCQDTEILDHLRHGGLHARGCWALDLILGKS
jgi:hypothetical protein